VPGEPIRTAGTIGPCNSPRYYNLVDEVEFPRPAILFGGTLHGTNRLEMIEMGALVLELQADALNRSVRASDLVRKALVVAVKLDLPDLKKWCDVELNGYTKEAIPDYREVRGEVRAWNPYHGWIPVLVNDSEVMEMLQIRRVMNPLASIEHSVYNKTESTIQMPYDANTLQLLASGFQGYAAGLIPTLLISRNSLSNILDAARTVVLDWSLRLEREGILGEGMTFTRSERERAARITYNVGSFSGVIGNVQGDIMRDVFNTQQAMAVGPMASAEANSVEFTQIWEHSADRLSLPELAADLSLLLPAMKEAASAPEQYQALAATAAAEAAAKSGDGPKALENLKNAGGWALAVAEKIGVTVASAALKESLGIK
jgi:hypothetical protein